ncbi:class I SAM-dependent methyltransferase [Mycolicibacterium sp.]|uniref:class I SAM-dependent methyltransferase n=1 Tax=Mycolicibacterium sp. TaxID=2320850 RepID=UPI003D0BAC2E
MTTRTATFGGLDLYRRLQEYKTDDLETVASFLEDVAQSTSREGSEKPSLVDVCAGVGRTVPLYDPDRWSITLIDSDTEALDKAKELYPHVRALRVDLSREVAPASFDVAVCLHNAANEVGPIDLLFENLRALLGRNARLLIDLRTGTGTYEFASLTETVRLLEVCGEEWLLETSVVHGCVPSLHTLLLFGRPVGNDGNLRPVVYGVERFVPTEQEFLQAAASAGFTLLNRRGRSCYDFRRAA